MPLTSDKRLLGLTTPLGKDALLVQLISGEERVSGLYSFTLDALSETENIDFDALVGKTATLRIKLSDDGNRYWHGVISHFSQIGTEETRYRYRAVLVPWLWLLQHTANCRVFQDKSVPQIIENVFKTRGFNDFKTSLSKSYDTRIYCVQYRESDFDFVSRLMEEEGIFYYFQHADGKHTMVLADASSAIPACAGKSSIPYRPKAGSSQGDDIASWQQSLTVTPVGVSLDNFDFEQPASRLIASSQTVATQGRQSALDVYDYPGRHSNVSAGANDAKLRMQEWEARQVRIEGAGTCRTLEAGRGFTLTQHFRSDYNAEYLLLSVRHEAVNNLPWSDGDGHYENRFTCQPKATIYRPPRATSRPIMFGTQTAIVVGPSGEEIYTDKYGRVKVQFHWDRAGQGNDQSSCWIRVSQSWAGVNWGTLHIPRVGQEVIVDFMEGDPDRPIITGQIYNAHKMPPYSLPGNKTQSGIKSRSTPGGTGENFNELRFEDKKDAEAIHFQAEKNFHRLVKNDDELKVGHDRTVEIKNNRTETVTEGNSACTVTKGTYTLTVEGDTTTEVRTGKHALLVSTGDVEQTVKQGHRKVDIAVGNDTLTIRNGNQITAIEAGKSATQAKQSIEFKVGGSSILLDSSGITIKGATVIVEGSSSAEVKAATVKVDGSNGVSVNSSGGDISASGLNVALQGTVGATLKGNASTEVASTGQTTIKGTVVMIN